MDYRYYYNNVPNIGQTRNNLIYTSLINEDKTIFVQHYFNDTEYHKNKNQVVDPAKMDEKWLREVKYLQLMRGSYPDLVPTVLDIDYVNRKIYLQIDGDDFWEQSNCNVENYYKVLPDWEDQMLDIIKAHKSLNLHKYSMHPSSYFIVDGRLKSINYFFTYHMTEPNICINDVSSHISQDRQTEMKKYVSDWDRQYTWKELDKLCWESFRNNYPESFVNRVFNELQIS